MQTPDGYRKKCKRYNEPGQAHYLTFSCYKNQPLLGNDRTRQWLVDAIAAAQAKHAFDLWAWVIMPEHVHLLILPHTDISTILFMIKKPVATAAREWLEVNAPQFIPRITQTRPDGSNVARF